VHIVSSATGNTVGGTASAAGNTIAFNAGDGVEVDGNGIASSNGDSILRNSIFANGGLGIDLVGGGNHDQPAPSITSVNTGGGTTTINGTLAGSASSTQFRIEVFVSPSCDPSGNGEGETFLGVRTVTT